MENKDLISVIIPVYNVEKYLEKCIESIINQTYKNLEIILVDDGSTDNCSKMCDEYEQKDNRIKVIHKENGGQAEARNVALDVMKGKYVTFLDADDYVSQDYIEYMYKNLIMKHVDISVCGVQIVNYENKEYSSEEKDIYVYTTEQALENMLYSNGIEVAVYAKLYGRECFDDVRFPVGEKYEDIAIIAKLLNQAKKIVYGDKKCYYYYTRQGSTSKSGFNKGELDYIKNVNEMLQYIENDYKSLKPALLRYKVYSSFRILRILLFSKNKNDKIQNEMIQTIKKFDDEVYKDSKVPRRDKIAILSLKCGLPFFKLLWFLYSKFTGRIL